MKQSLLCLYLLVFGSVLHAQSELPERARTRSQSQLGRGWFTDWEINFFRSRSGIDSLDIKEGDRDRSQVIRYFEPPSWMYDLTSSGYELARNANSGVEVGPGYIRQVIRKKDDVVRIIDWHRLSRYERHYREHVTDRLFDSTDYSVRYRRDSTYDAEGHIREVVYDSNVVALVGDEVIWSHGRRKLTFEGTPPWIQRTSKSGGHARLTRDGEGNGVIIVTEEPIVVDHKILQLPVGYSESALKIGPNIDSVHQQKQGKATVLSRLVWRDLPSPETVELLDAPLFIYEGRLLASYISVDSNQIYSKRKTEYDFSRDTIERSFDDRGRLTYDRRSSHSTSYKYTGSDWLIEVEDAYYGIPEERRRLTFSIGPRGMIAAMFVTSMKFGKDRYGSSRDTVVMRQLNDFCFPEFYRVASKIEDIADLKVNGQSLFLSLRSITDSLTPDAEALSAELVDLDGNTKARSSGNIMMAEALVPGIYQLRYNKGASTLYIQTVAIDEY